jgi:hypothetical protein
VNALQLIELMRINEALQIILQRDIIGLVVFRKCSSIRVLRERFFF